MIWGHPALSGSQIVREAPGKFPRQHKQKGTRPSWACCSPGVTRARSRSCCSRGTAAVGVDVGAGVDVLRVLLPRRGMLPQAVPDRPHRWPEGWNVTTATCRLQSQSCSFIFDIPVTSTAQGCENGGRCLEQLLPPGSRGDRTRAPRARRRLFQQIPFPAQAPL